MGTPTRLSYLKDNLITSSSMLSSDHTRAGYSLADLINGDPWATWRSDNVTGTKEILISFTATQDITFLGLANHNLSSSGSFTLDYGSTAACSDGSVVLSMTPNNFGYFTDTPLSYKYFKLCMNESVSDGYIEIGELEMGRYTEVPYNPVIPIKMINEMEIQSIVTAGGQEWSYRKYHKKGWIMRWIEDNDRDAYASLEQLWEAKGKDIPFFICPQPSTHPEDILYVRIKDFSFEVNLRDSRPGTIVFEEAK
ncbi:MAG: hypothetical protein DRI01_00540 [Chloroflexi bacterium]|nr:MAG: hypothetical protein DRI01_00540 [Chloroflexota bacterium]